MNVTLPGATGCPWKVTFPETVLVDCEQPGRIIASKAATSIQRGMVRFIGLARCAQQNFHQSAGIGWPSLGTTAIHQVVLLSPWDINRTLPSASPTFIPDVCPD